MYRTRDWRRHETSRVIHERLDVIRNVWASNYDISRGIVHPWLAQPGRVRKYNLACTCGLCQDQKYRDHRARANLDAKYFEEEQLFDCE